MISNGTRPVYRKLGIFQLCLGRRLAAATQNKLTLLDSSLRNQGSASRGCWRTKRSTDLSSESADALFDFSFASVIIPPTAKPRCQCRYCPWKEPEKEVRAMFDGEPEPPPPSEGGWLANLAPSQQLGYGCIGVMIAGASVLYCLGIASFFVRPLVLERAVLTPTIVIRPTLVPTPTQQVQPTFIQLPPGTLVATPTQAPLPIREPATATRVPDLGSTPSLTSTLTSGTPRGTPSLTAEASATRKASATAMPVPILWGTPALVITPTNGTPHGTSSPTAKASATPKASATATVTATTTP
jgi:hypothetical protein